MTSADARLDRPGHADVAAWTRPDGVRVVSTVALDATAPSFPTDGTLGLFLDTDAAREFALRFPWAATMWARRVKRQLAFAECLGAVVPPDAGTQLAAVEFVLSTDAHDLRLGFEAAMVSRTFALATRSAVGHVRRPAMRARSRRGAVRRRRSAASSSSSTSPPGPGDPPGRPARVIVRARELEAQTIEYNDVGSAPGVILRSDVDGADYKVVAYLRDIYATFCGILVDEVVMFHLRSVVA